MPSIVRYEPFRVSLGSVARDLDRVFDRVFEDMPGFAARTSHSRPAGAANLYETPEAYWVELPLPGVRPEDVEVTVQENMLTLQAKRAWQTPENAKTIWQGFGQGEWRQSFTLPGEVNNEKVSASLEYGVLRLELPKAEHARPRTIRVNAGPAITAAPATAPAAEVREAKPAAESTDKTEA
jgi:HSP20 family protein